MIDDGTLAAAQVGTDMQFRCARIGFAARLREEPCELWLFASIGLRGLATNVPILSSHRLECQIIQLPTPAGAVLSLFQEIVGRAAKPARRCPCQNPGPTICAASTTGAAF